MKKKPLLETFRRIGGKLPVNESKLDDALDKAFGEIYEDEEVDDILDELNDELEDRGVEDIYDKWRNDEPLTEEEKARLLAVFKMFP